MFKKCEHIKDVRISGESIADLSIFEYEKGLKIFYMKEYQTLKNLNNRCILIKDE